MSLHEQAKQRAKDRVERVRKACGSSHSDDHPLTEASETTPRKARKRGGHCRVGNMEGAAAKARLDRAGYKSGGGVKKGATEVNIIISPQGAGGTPPGAGPVPAPPMPPPGMPPAGAMPGGGAGAMPPGAMPPPGMGAKPPMPPPMRKSGGRVRRKEGGVADMDAGAGSGLGRLEKAAAYGAKP